MHLPENTPSRFRKTRGLIVLSVLSVLASLVWVLWWHRPSPPPKTESIFLFEDLPPEPTPQVRPDPSPPRPELVPEPAHEETPPPQFGLQDEQLSETGDLAVATGNTLMTEADTFVKAPAEILPAVPQLVDQAPRIMKGSPPEYPIRALERGLEATVVVIITIDTLGRVVQADIERSGGRDFDPEVVRAVKNLVFQPPVRGGKRIAARFRQPYEFRLE
jgi:TonB family protein